MTRPFEGIRIIDVTHVLAGPFAADQLAVLGADVIKVEHPEEPDQTRSGGTDRALNRRAMGTSYLTQGSNKRSITLHLKSEAGREIIKRLVQRADIVVENYRPGAFAALGLGYNVMSEINPRLIHCSISAFGQDGPRGSQTAYDHVIHHQAWRTEHRDTPARVRRRHRQGARRARPRRGPDRGVSQGAGDLTRQHKIPDSAPFSSGR